jgi:hypothetical protein
VIILSGVLVVIAIALLVAGIVVGETGGQIAGWLDGMTVIYMSIAVSIVSFLCLLVGVFLRRKELFGTGLPAAPSETSRRKAKGRSRHKAAGARGEPSATAVLPSPSVPSESTVFIIPGRKRYHLASCRQLAGRDKEELTFEEAREEGFTPCTACIPDTALAARAAAGDTASTPPEAGESGGSATEPGPGGTSAATGMTGAAGTALGAEGGAGTAAENPGSARGPFEARGRSGVFGRETPPADPPGVAAAPAAGAAADTVGNVRVRHPATDPTGAARPQTPAGSGGAPGGGAAGAGSAAQVRVLSGTRRYHRPDCALIEDIAGEESADDLETLSAEAARAKGYTACLVCRPDREHAR